MLQVSSPMFSSRQDAGKQLAEKLQPYADKPDTLVLGLPRGGVVVASEVARVLNLPLDIVVPRKIGAPNNPEFAIGAIDEDGELEGEENIIRAYGITPAYLESEIAKEKQEAQRRLKLYRGNRPALDLKKKTVILVDDGVATGATMRAAMHSIKKKGAGKIIAAVPVGASDSLEEIKSAADELICLSVPEFFGAVGMFYENFEQIEDEEVVLVLEENWSKGLF